MLRWSSTTRTLAGCGDGRSDSSPAAPGAASVMAPSSLRLAPLFNRGRSLERQPDDEGRPHAGRAPHLERPPVVVDDALHHGEAEPGAGRLGGEEGLEDAVAHLVGDARAGVRDL